MNIGSYESVFSQIKEKRITFLDFIDYANHLLNKENNDLFLKPEVFISVFTQAERLLQPDLLNIHVNPFYQTYLEKENDLLQSLKNKRIHIAFKNILAQQQPKNVLSEIVNALKSLSNKPIVLTIDSPQKWLLQVQETVSESKLSNFSLDDFERASMYMAELLRAFSTLGISAIVLSETNEIPFSLEELLNSYQPIINVANHYKWRLGIHLESTSIDIAVVNDKVDFYLNQSLGIEELSPFWEKGLSVGGGLNREFWKGNLQQKIEPNRGLLYGKIPADAEPETVLAQLKALQS